MARRWPGPARPVTVARVSPTPPISWPAAVTARPLTARDVPAVTDLLAAWERVEPTDAGVSEIEVGERFAAPTAALDGGGVAVLDGDRVVGYGLLHVIAAEPLWLAHSDGGVHPDWHRRGIGARILQHQLTQARRLREHRSPGRPGEVRAVAAHSRAGTGFALESCGFRTQRFFARMRADLRAAAPAPAVTEPVGVRIRPYRAADDEAVRLASNAAFADHWRSVPRNRDVWQADYSGASAFRPAASLVAEAVGGAGDAGAGIVGFLLTAEHDADTERRGYRTGYISRLGTVRAVRGRGVGTALVARALGTLRDQGFAAAELHVDADSPTGAGRLYSRLGFEVVDQERLLTRRL